MNTLKKLLSIGTLLCFGYTVFAIPAWHGVQTVKQPDGSTLTYRLVGDEHYHGFLTTDGYMIKPGDDGAMYYVSVDGDGIQTLSSVVAHDVTLRTPAEIDFVKTHATANFEVQRDKVMPKRAQNKQLRLPGGEFPTTGNLKGLILLVEFANNSMQEGNDSELFNRLMNEEGFDDDGATGSARDYFISQSMGEFTPDFDVYGPIKLPRSILYYGANNGFGQDNNPMQMVIDACQLADEQFDVDFSKYDYNNDNILDFVYIIYAGYAESYGASSNTIWPHASNLVSYGLDVKIDGKQIQRYACSSELKYVSGTQLEGIGTFCHEFSHVLGLPDIYNTYSTGSPQLGSWDIMDTGCYNNESHTPPSYSSFERFSLGWLEYIDLDTPADYIELLELTENNVAYRICTKDENEFFTLENRQQKGWDAYQPGTGMMVLHVAYEPSAWNGNYVNSGTFPRYDLVEADGTQGTGESTDLYPAGGTYFTDYSKPNSLSWDGTPTEKGVSNIKDNDGVISFRFMNDRLQRPVVCDAENISTSSFTARWEPVEGAVGYRLNIYEVLPESLNPIAIDEDFSLIEEGEYPKNDIYDIAEDINEYTHTYGWDGINLYQAGGYLMIGAYGTCGAVATPVSDFSRNDGDITVAVSVKSYPGKTLNYAISAIDYRTNNVLDTHILKATKTEADAVVTFSGGSSQTYINVETDHERLYLNRIRVLSGIVAPEDVWTVGPKDWSIDNITETFYEVTGLENERTYRYTVEALAGPDMMGSLPSDVVEVTTGDNAGVGSTIAEANVVSVEYYDVTGRTVIQPQNGLYIRRTVMSDGSVSTDKIIIK